MADVKEQSRVADEKRSLEDGRGATRAAPGPDGSSSAQTDMPTPPPTEEYDTLGAEVPVEEPLGNQAEGPRPRGRRKRTLFLAGGAIVLIAGLVAGLLYYLNARHYESTDDAFIDGHIIEVSPKVAGYVKKVYVTDNEQVKQGDLLVEIDAADFENRVEQARSALNAALARRQAAQSDVALTRATTQAGVQEASSGVQAARSGVSQSRAQAAAQRSRANQAGAAVATAQASAEQAQAEVAAAQAQAVRANADAVRYRELYSKDEVSKQQLDQAVTTAAAANAQVEAATKRAAAALAQVGEARSAHSAAAEQYRQAQAQITGAQAQVGEAVGRLNQSRSAPQQVQVKVSQVNTSSAEIAQAEAAVKQAELDLSYTKIYAPETGRVTKKSVETGQYLQTGAALLAVVPGDVWVTANFKETQLTNMRPNQPVEIKVDAFPNRTFKGHVDSIQAGTGSRFSLLPAENATGNYVKVVQRVPVKIVFDDPPENLNQLAPGMSAEPEVKVT